MSWLTPWTLFEFIFPQWYTNKTSSFDISPRREFNNGSSLTQVFTWLLRQTVSFPYSLLQRWIGRCVSILGRGWGGGGHLREVWVEVCRYWAARDLQTLTSLMFFKSASSFTHMFTWLLKAGSFISIFAGTKVNRMLRQYLRPGGALTGTLGRGLALKTWPYLRKKMLILLPFCRRNFFINSNHIILRTKSKENRTKSSNFPNQLDVLWKRIVGSTHIDRSSLPFTLF